MAYTLDSFGMDLRKCVTPPNHIWVNSGYNTCAPMHETACGIAGCFSPPLAAGDLTWMLEITANGHLVPDTGNKGKEDCGLLYAGGTWRPDQIIRYGTYHYMVGDTLLSFHVTSRLVPLVEQCGFVTEIAVKNRMEQPLPLQFTAKVNPGCPRVVPLGDWEFMPPRPEDTVAAKAISANEWENDGVRVTLFTEGDSATAAPGGTVIYRAAVILTPAGTKVEQQPLEALQTASIRFWQARIDRANETLPSLFSDIPGLTDYYNRSLLSGLVSLWEKDEYIVKPFPATSGVDGGSICCYPWDVAGYSAEMLVLYLGDKAQDFIRAMLSSGIDRHISMSLDGGGLGWCCYAYSMWSIMNLYWKVLTLTGKGQELFDEIVKIFLTEEERLPEWEHLKDYGRQHNLLEMRSCGYEYYVCSPNAERAWCYDRMADIADMLGRENSAAWREKAEAIRASIRTHLWDEEAGWFKCLHPKGHVEMVYSIQQFDAMRMSVCDEHMKQAMLKQVRDGAFLGGYGVSSISAEDELHYELNDPDWSGGGSYTGDGPNLAETLWNNHFPEKAWEVLKRHFWMGQQLLYYPQEHYCDKPAVPANKRANIIAGVAGMEAILSGLAGIAPQLNGSVAFDPMPPADGTIEIKNVRVREDVYALTLRQDFVMITKNGAVAYEGAPKKIVL